MAKKKRTLVHEKDVEIPSYSVLLGYLIDDSVRRSPTRVYELFVVIQRSIVYRTGPIDWTRNGLNDGVRKIRNYYAGKVPAKAGFVLRIWYIKWGNPVVASMLVPQTLSGKDYFRNLPTLLPTGRRSRQPSGRSQGGGSNLPFDGNKTRLLAYKYKVDGSTGAYELNQTLSVFLRQSTSVRTPGFRKKARTGSLPQNPYHLLQTTVTPGSLQKSTILTAPDYYGYNYQTWSAFPDLSTANCACPHQSMDDNKLIVKLADRISGPSANIGEDIATIRQTIGLFTTKVAIYRAASKAIADGNVERWARFVQHSPSKALTHASRSMVKAGKSSPLILSELWLEYRYGMIPLLSTIEALVAAFCKLHARQPALGRATASSTKVYHQKTVVSGYTDIHPLEPAGFVQYHWRTTRRFIINYQLQSQVTNVLANLGLTSPVSLGWELVPFSFVVDWFFPIGNALNAYHAFEGLAFKSGCAIRFSKLSTDFVIQKTVSDPLGPGGPARTDKASGQSSGRSVLYDREVLTDFPSPKLPQFKNPVSVIHAANAVALLLVMLTGKSTSRSFIHSI